MLMLLIGALLAMIGQDPIGAMVRFDFGFHALQAGIDLLPLVIGLFAIPEILLAMERRESAIVAGASTRPEGDRLRWADLRPCMRTIFRSTALGGVIGAIPGVGAGRSRDHGLFRCQECLQASRAVWQGELEGVAPRRLRTMR